MTDGIGTVLQHSSTITTVIGGADRCLGGAVGVVNLCFVQQVIHINAPQHIAAADKQPQRGRNDRQVVHFCQQIRKAADHSHMVAFHKSHQCMDVGLILVSGDGQSGTIQQTGEHFLHKDVKRTDGILQHDITGAGMELVGKGTDIMANIAVGDTDTFGPPGGT